MNPKQFQQHLKDLEKRAGGFMRTDAPHHAANKAVEKFKENFENEGFFGKKWQEVQRRDPKTPAYRHLSKRHPADTRRKILSGRTGNLRNSINYRVEPGRAIVYSDTTYGKFHNEGDAPQPQRQFMGGHPDLNRAVIDELDKQVKKLFKK